MKTIPFQPLDPALYREIVRRALAEDLGWGDVTTEAHRSGRRTRAKAFCWRSRHACSPDSTWRPKRSGSSTRAARLRSAAADGDRCEPGDVVADVARSGRARC